MFGDELLLVRTILAVVLALDLRIVMNYWKFLTVIKLKMHLRVMMTSGMKTLLRRILL